jgi:hypothetical protein
MIAAFNGLSLLVRFATVAGVVLFIVGSIAVYNESKRKEGEARVIERSQKQGKINEAKARKAHDRAAAPGAPKRVLEQFCRDCN